MRKNSPEAARIRPCPALLAAVIVVSTFAGIFVVLKAARQDWIREERLRVWEELSNRRASLESELFARIYHTRSMAAYVSLRPDLSDREFENLAAELIRGDPVVNTMTIAPEGVIRDVYPRNGHEEAIGLDLMAHPERRKIVEKTIQTGRTFVAGPVELVEGGQAFISYTPVFDKTGAEPEFWGMTDISIRAEEFFDRAELGSPLEGARLALRGTDGKGPEGAVFRGEPSVFEGDPVEVKVILPDGFWVLGADFDAGWTRFARENRPTVLLIALAGLVVPVLAVLLVCGFFRLRASKQRLALLNADKNRLISVMSHDVRSPLAAAAGLLDEMDRSPVQRADDERESLDMVRGSVHDALLLLENLLEWVRNRDTEPLLRPESVSLSGMVDSVFPLFQATARRKGIDLRNRVREGTAVFADPRALQTVLRNLVGNAVKFSESGQAVEVGCTGRVDGSREIYVRDNGLGMDAGRLRELEGEFPVSSRPGTLRESGGGLGLLLCRQLLRRGGSDLRIESAPGKGTTVRFVLPSSDPDGRQE